jgi:hypothetical protein
LDVSALRPFASVTVTLTVAVPLASQVTLVESPVNDVGSPALISHE